jgi:hypothetical protein
MIKGNEYINELFHSINLTRYAYTLTEYIEYLKNQPPCLNRLLIFPAFTVATITPVLPLTALKASAIPNYVPRSSTGSLVFLIDYFLGWFSLKYQMTLIKL